MKIWLCFIVVTGNIQSLEKRSLEVKCYVDLEIAEQVKTLRERSIMLRYTYTVYFFHVKVSSISEVWSLYGSDCEIYFIVDGYIL